VYGCMYEGPEMSDELNQNHLFAKSKLRLSCRSSRDRESPRNGPEADFIGEQGRRSLAQDSVGFIAPRRDPTDDEVERRARFRYADDKIPEPVTVFTGLPQLHNGQSVSCDHDKDSTVLVLPEERRIMVKTLHSRSYQKNIGSR